MKKLKEKEILNNRHADIAIEANGLRNRVIHRYNSVDEKIFIESSKELLPKLSEVFESVENFIQKVENEPGHSKKNKE